MIRKLLSFGLFALVAVPVSAQDLPEYDAMTRTYICESGTEVVAAYINTPDGLSLAVITVRGELMVLEIAISGSGARYATRGAGERYVWWTRGDEAFLQRGPDGAEEMVLQDCASEAP